MTRTVTVDEATSDLSRLLDEVNTGSEVIIERAGRPIARLVPFRSGPRRRTPGAWQGRGGIVSDVDGLLDEVSASIEADLT